MHKRFKKAGLNDHTLAIVLEGKEGKLKFDRWNTQYLSLGGRLTLLNSVLDALPIFMMSVFPIPTEVINWLDSIRKNF